MDPKTGEVADPEVLAEQDIRTESVEETKEVPRPKSPRDLATEEIARRAHKRMEKEMKSLRVDSIDDAGVITPTTQPEPEPEPVEASEPAAEAIPEKTDAPSPAPAPLAAPEEERELIVDGKKIRVPLSKIIDSGVRTFQKETAADMRLAAATELLRSAQQRQAEPPAAPVAQPSDEDADLARAIQFGTEDEARAAIARVRNATPAITPQQIDAYVQQVLTQKLPDHQAFHEANAWLRTNYAAITDDPDLKHLFDRNEDQARKSGDRRPYKELYVDLAKQMATKFKLTESAPAPATQAQDRVTRKANSPRPLTGASGRIDQPQGPQRAPTVSEYVTRQRQIRGLQPLDKQGI